MSEDRIVHSDTTDLKKVNACLLLSRKLLANGFPFADQGVAEAITDNALYYTPRYGELYHLRSLKQVLFICATLQIMITWIQENRSKKNCYVDDCIRLSVQLTIRHDNMANDRTTEIDSILD